jgi:hypothetical protein
MRLVAVFLAVLSGASPLRLLPRDTNSAAATKRGLESYAAKQFGEATTSFAKANGYRQTPTTLFNLGTAQIAAGRREEGSAALTAAMKDRALRAAALYNRGNSALAASSFDYAIRDYIEALKLRPGDLATKRNLEIALNRKAQAQQSRSGQQKNPQGSNPQQEQKNQQQTPNAAQQRQLRQDANTEALLRAVQQQEQEELERMKRVRAAHGRVGW